MEECPQCGRSCFIRSTGYVKYSSYGSDTPTLMMCDECEIEWPPSQPEIAWHRTQREPVDITNISLLTVGAYRVRWLTLKPAA